MRIIFITDTHGMVNNPVSRKDVFQETLLNKMRYIGEYIKENKVDLLIHGGDWLHTPDVSENFIREFSKIIKGYECDVVGVIGNHDCYGYNADTFNRTTFGVAEGLGVFRRLGSEPLIIGDVALTGVDTCRELDKKGNENLYTDSKKIDGKVNIHVVHGMLVKNKWDMVAHTVIGDIASECTADIVLSGHEHKGFGVIEKDGTTFSNPGSLVRITSSTGDLRKDVRFTQIDTKNENYDIMLVNLPDSVAKTATEVLDLDAILLDKQKRANIDAFIQQIGDKNLNDSTISYKAALDSLELENEVYDGCMHYIEVAQEELGKVED